MCLQWRVTKMSDKSSSSSSAVSDVVELNVGGVTYTTSRPTLINEQESVLAKWFGVSGESGEKPPVRDKQGRYFIDRDGALFRYILEES